MQFPVNRLYLDLAVDGGRLVSSLPYLTGAG